MEVGKSVFYPDSEVGSYSEIGRDSMPVAKAIEREMKSIEIIAEEREDATSEIRPKPIPSCNTTMTKT
jgi:hypothetical protein